MVQVSWKISKGFLQGDCYTEIRISTHQAFSGLAAAKRLVGASPQTLRIEPPQSSSILLLGFLHLLSKKPVVPNRLVQWDIVGQNLHCSYEAHPPSIACMRFILRSARRPLRGEKWIMRVPIRSV